MRRISLLITGVMLFTAAGHRAMALEQVKTDASAPIELTLEKCIDMALNNNSDLIAKLNALNDVDADAYIERSRFFNHVDVIADFKRQRGTLPKTTYANLSPQAPFSLGSYDISNYNIEDLNLSSIGGMDLGSLSNMDLGNIDLSQFGLSGVDLSNIDLSQFFGRRGLSVRDASVDVDGDGQDETLEEILALYLDPTYPMSQDELLLYLTQYFGEDVDVNQLIGTVQELSDSLQDATDAINKLNDLTSTSTSRKPDVSSRLSIRYSRRLMEFGRDPDASVAIRDNRRRAINDYQSKMREVIYNVRRNFYVILLKQQQIATRNQLLNDFEDKHRKLQQRFETAQDVLKIDVLTAELDVLNEKMNINTLEKDLIKAKMELLNYIGMPVDTGFEVIGQIEPFKYTIDEVVDLTLSSSFQMEYLRQELEEQRRNIKELEWDYRPKFTAKAAWEDKRTSLALALNNTNQTYGVDFSAEQFLNMPNDSGSISLSNSGKQNYSVSLGVTYPLYDGTRRQGLKMKEEIKLSNLINQLVQQRRTEELNARKAFQTLLEAKESVSLQEERVAISKRRLEITQILRDKARATEVQLETYRDRFFSDQDGLFRDQENVINAEENLRRIMGVFY